MMNPAPVRTAPRRPAPKLATALLLALAACHAAPAALDDAPLAGAALGGPFTLTDKAGHTVRWSDFAGKWRIVYFGYTFCPDACPTDMSVEGRALALFAKAHASAADHIAPIFITIDPARDTPKAVGQFAAAFSPRLIGLTGTPAQIAEAAKAFGAYYARGHDTPGGYLMEHSRMALLFGPQGQPVELLPLDKGAAATEEVLEKWVR